MRPGEIVAGAGGLILAVSLFLKWFGRSTAWQALAVIDVLVALIALLAIAVPIVSATAQSPAKPIAIEVIASVFTALGVLLVAFRLLANPGSVQGGAWLGLAGALIAFVGSWLAMRDESTPGAAPPDMPRRPAPPRAAA